MSRRVRPALMSLLAAAQLGCGQSSSSGSEWAMDAGGGAGGADAGGGAAADARVSSSDTGTAPRPDSAAMFDSAAPSDASSSGGSPAATLAGKLGKPSRLLFGLGGGNDPSVIKSQGITPDLHERYLVNVGANDWTTWNSPPGAYVGVVATDAESLGAVPMYTLYQMATNGDGNITDIDDPTFMTAYWANTRLLFQQLAAYGKPALVHFEPDFWGYTEQHSPGNDPTMLPAQVTVATECASLPNNVAGIAQCLIHFARTLAPNAYVGFSPSTWGASALTDVVAFFRAIGAGNADFVVMQTLDRDAGCFEAATEADCMRSGSGWYWDETNATHPNFQDHLAMAQTFSQTFQLPLVWWQTPLGVPSTTPGGTSKHYRDDRVHYFLTHPAELVAAGGLGVVFGAGASNETDITTDNGQMKTLSAAYLASPAPL